MLRRRLRSVETQIAGKTWIMGEDLHDGRLRRGAGAVLCRQGHAVRGDPQGCAAYLERLMQRPSYARALKEAEPYFKLFPQEDAA